jgi:homocysteine S-methyltransferase
MNSPYDRIRRALKTGDTVILDGGVSTELERRGAPMVEGAWSGKVAIDAWDVLVDTHRAYIDAGSNIITANTYASSRLVLEPTGLGDKVEEINRRSLEAALTARERCGAPDVAVAGSISHMLPMATGAHGHGSTERSNLSRDILFAAFQEMASYHAAGGADLLLLEMMSLPDLMSVLFDAVADVSLPVWCGLSAKRKIADGPISAWHDETVPFSDNVARAAERGFEVMGIMHTSADLIADTVPLMREHYSGPLMAYPDSGYFEMPHWRFVDTLTPLEFRDFVRGWVELGVQIVGGCCGLGPEHISAIADL